MGRLPALTVPVPMTSNIACTGAVTSLTRRMVSEPSEKSLATAPAPTSQTVQTVLTTISVSIELTRLINTRLPGLPPLVRSPSSTTIKLLPLLGSPWSSINSLASTETSSRWRVAYSLITWAEAMVGKRTRIGKMASIAEVTPFPAQADLRDLSFVRGRTEANQRPRAGVEQ